jgi:hypothetical protein
MGRPFVPYVDDAPVPPLHAHARTCAANPPLLCLMARDFEHDVRSSGSESGSDGDGDGDGDRDAEDTERSPRDWLSWLLWQLPEDASLNRRDGRARAPLSPRHLAAVAMPEAGQVLLDVPCQRFGGGAHTLRLLGPVTVEALLRAVHAHYAADVPADVAARLVELKEVDADAGYAASAIERARRDGRNATWLDLIGTRPSRAQRAHGHPGAGLVFYEGVRRSHQQPARYQLLLGS